MDTGGRDTWGTERQRQQETDPDKCRWSLERGQKPREKQTDRPGGCKDQERERGDRLLRQRHAKTRQTSGETHSALPQPHPAWRPGHAGLTLLDFRPEYVKSRSP